MDYIKAFLVGGTICFISQILIDKTKLTPARILVSYVVLGVFLGAIGVYKPLVDFAGAGATVPLTGFGYNLAKGVKEAIGQDGFLGIFTGGLKSAAGGITAAVLGGCSLSGGSGFCGSSCSSFCCPNSRGTGSGDLCLRLLCSRPSGRFSAACTASSRQHHRTCQDHTK